MSLKPDAFDWMVEHFIQDGILVPHDPTGKWWCIERRELAKLFRLQHASAVRLVKRKFASAYSSTSKMTYTEACDDIMAGLEKMKEAT